MLAMEQAGADLKRSGGVDQFISAYEALSITNRDASREASILEHGSIRNARPDAADEDEMLTAPLVPADPAEPLMPVRGLTAVQADLATARGLVETRQAFLAQVEVQIAAAEAQLLEDEARLADLRTRRERLIGDINAAMTRAVADLSAANGLQKQAIDIATTRGKSAARAAEQAVNNIMNDARNANSAESPNPRLDLIANKSRFLAGHAKTLAADFDFLAARVHAQQADGFRRQGDLLTLLNDIGIDTGPALLPEGVEPGESSAGLYTAQAARAQSSEAQAAAVTAAEQAVLAYNEAATSLGELWVVHANAAAVEYLLGGLTTGDASQQHLAKARDLYERSIRNRTDAPQSTVYQDIVARLSQASP
jgi:hypothetical protein